MATRILIICAALALLLAGLAGLLVSGIRAADSRASTAIDPWLPLRPETASTILAGPGNEPLAFFFYRDTSGSTIAAPEIEEVRCQEAADEIATFWQKAPPDSRIQCWVTAVQPGGPRCILDLTVPKRLRERRKIQETIRTDAKARLLNAVLHRGNIPGSPILEDLRTLCEQAAQLGVRSTVVCATDCEQSSALFKDRFYTASDPAALLKIEAQKFTPMTKAPDRVVLVHLYHGDQFGPNYQADYDRYASTISAELHRWRIPEVVRMEVRQAGPGLPAGTAPR